MLRFWVEGPGNCIQDRIIAGSPSPNITAQDDKLFSGTNDGCREIMNLAILIHPQVPSPFALKIRK
jgi:hypothetical protein